MCKAHNFSFKIVIFFEKKKIVGSIPLNNLLNHENFLSRVKHCEISGRII